MLLVYLNTVTARRGGGSWGALVVVRVVGADLDGAVEEAVVA